MNKRFALAFTAVAILAGIGSVSMHAQPAAAAEAYGKSCACYGGSDPEGPQEPGTPWCMEWLYDQCSSDSDCSCS